MIVLKHVTKNFGRTKVLSDVSLQIDPQEFVCITGPSGAGKSTLIHLLVGAEEVSSGTVEVDGVNLRTVPPLAMQMFRRRVGVVFQDYKLLAHRTVEENVAFPLEVCGVPDSVIRRRTADILKRMKLTDRAKSFPRELSGGEKARTAIARAIVHEPLIILADEPTGNVDPRQSAEILDLFRQIHEEGTTVIIATHDTGLVDKMQTRVIRLDQGRIVRDEVGGYHPAAAVPEETTTVEHKIFRGAPEMEPSLEGKRVKSDKTDQQPKIKIVSIGS